MHEIFKGFIERVQEATDDATADRIFDEVASSLLVRPEYARFDEGESAYSLKLALNECRKYCHKMSRFYSESQFKPKNNSLEVGFGFGAENAGGYPAVNLLGGKIKLSGKIDRVDEYKDYYRIIDYKTGGSEVGDDKIFAGVKLQLYLYSLAITDKTLAGAYYLRVNDEYGDIKNKVKPLMEGKTAIDTECYSEREAEFLPSGGKNKTVDLKTLSGVREYARKMAEQAAAQLEDGVILPSAYSGTCEYCAFSSLCHDRLPERKVTGVDTEFIAKSTKDGKNYA